MPLILSILTESKGVCSWRQQVRGSLFRARSVMDDEISEPRRPPTILPSATKPIQPPRLLNRFRCLAIIETAMLYRNNRFSGSNLPRFYLQQVTLV